RDGDRAGRENIEERLHTPPPSVISREEGLRALSDRRPDARGVVVHDSAAPIREIRLPSVGCERTGAGIAILAAGLSVQSRIAASVLPKEPMHDSASYRSWVDTTPLPSVSATLRCRARS